MWKVRRTCSEKKRQSKNEKGETEQPGKVDESVNCAEDLNNEVGDAGCVSGETILDLPNPKWVKVGQIQELYIYPLKSGRGKNVRECDFTEYGICVENDGRFALRDR